MTIHDRRGLTSGVVMVAAAVLSLLVGGVATAKETLQDDWFGLDLAGATVGWSHTLVEEDGDRRNSRTEMEMTLKRGATEIKVSVTSSWVETTSGQPVSAELIQDMSMMKTVSKWTFTPDGIDVVETSGGAPVARKVPKSEETWLTPYAAFEYVHARIKAGDKEIKVLTMSPEIGPKVVEVTYTWIGEEKITIKGKEIPTTVWKLVNGAMPTIESKVWVSSDGILVTSETNIGVGIMKMTLMDKAAAMQEPDAAPEVFYKLLVEPDRAIPDPWAARRAVLRVNTKDGKPLDLPSTGCQSIAGTGDGTVTVVVDCDSPQPASSEELADPALLGQSVMIDPKDDRIVAIHATAVADLPATATTLERAKAIRTYVYEYIDAKNLGTAFASASEVARTRSGDCSEHGVLLAAMLRADGIPARVVTGLVYVPGIRDNGVFGWHMWTQGLIDGNWVDLDATLPVAFSAGHITTGTSTLEEGSGAADMASIISSINNIDIEVVSVEHE